jgi:hypothetical protein
MAVTKQGSLRVEQLEDRSLLSAGFVLEWNGSLLDVQQLRGQGNQQSARALAIMGAAVYDAVNAIHPTHTVFHVDATAFPDVATASADAAAAQAAHDVAYGLYTQAADRARFDALLTTQLAEVPDGPAEASGIALGHYVAGQMLAWRANDGSSAVVPYTIGTAPGDWQPTPPAFAQTPATPQWPYVTPFAMSSGSQFRAGPPPALTSAEYAAAFAEVKALGGDGVTTPSTRTPEQTEIALFWAGLGVSNAGVAIWNQITQTVSAAHHLSLADNARLFAEVSVAGADAFIAGFDTKYAYNFWRPVTAIRAADTDGNPNTVQDATWTPLIPTPNHPSYLSLHATQSRAAAEALAAFFGTDHVSFTATWAGVDRSFTKFTDAAKEAGMSRIYAGIHWSFDMAAGEQQGRKVGTYVAANYFQPLTDLDEGPGPNPHSGRNHDASSLFAGGDFSSPGGETQVTLGGQTPADTLARWDDSAFCTLGNQSANGRGDPLTMRAPESSGQEDAVFDGRDGNAEPPWLSRFVVTRGPRTH